MTSCRWTAIVIAIGGLRRNKSIGATDNQDFSSGRRPLERQGIAIIIYDVWIWGKKA